MLVVGWVVRCVSAAGDAQLPEVTPAVVLVAVVFRICTPVGGRKGCLLADRRTLVVRCHHVISAVIVRYFAHRWVAAGGIAQLAVGNEGGGGVEGWQGEVRQSRGVYREMDKESLNQSSLQTCEASVQ